jgi:hypothetical protein
VTFRNEVCSTFTAMGLRTLLSDHIYTNRVGKKCREIQQEHLLEDRQKWRILCHWKMTHPSATSVDDENDDDITKYN